MYQMDIKNAFLYGDLNETVYMEQPPGYVAQGEKQCMVCKLKKAIYGLKQSPRACDLVGIEEAKTYLQKHFVTKDLGRPSFMDKPRSVHWEAALRILKYIKASPGKGLLFKRYGHVKIEAYSDADYAGAKDDRKSISGYCTYVGGNLVTWRSKKQTKVARSSAEAEYRAMAHTTSEILWLKNLLKELGFMYDDPVPMHCDNQTAIHIASNPIFHEMTKHIEVDCHFVREAIMSQKICTPFTPSSEQRADTFTKALGGKPFDVLCNKLGMIDIFAPAWGSAARALANLAAHGDSNSINAAVGQEAGALDALVQLTRSPHDGVKQEAAGALWNLSFDYRNQEAIAAAGGVEALDVHETAAGALWNLAFNPGNALRIVDEGGVPALVHLCSSSVSKMTLFMSALALAYMFDGRMDEIALVGTSTEGSSKSINLDGPRRMALKNIEAFVLTFADPKAFSAAAASSAPAALSQVTESARIQEAGHLRCSGAEIGRFVAMLRNPSPTLKSCAAFALLQFTIPGGRHAAHHVNLLQIAGAQRLLCVAAAAAGAPLEAKIFARIVLRNLEQHQTEPHL
ncbi:UNVERIFIED_CONTAM: protein ARABIDILLO 2 [Sesamum angustifolium]|uniref:Protein ARABIDILLO 2 n=1 Tax=Sesamum angustifolium TaxID=2727405 RepID=A0AAW2J664_9LAMI